MFMSWIRAICQSGIFYLKHAPNCGFGVFARRRISFDEARSSLLGWLSPIFADDYERLIHAKHPSLFGSPTSGDCYILIGALSLVNHSCVAKVAFGKPTAVPNSMQRAPTTPQFVRLDKDIRLLQIIDASDGGEHPGWGEDDEILVNYGARAVRDCKCVACYREDAADDDLLTCEEPPRKLVKL